MSDVVIKAEGLGKKYTIGHQAENGSYLALRDVLMENARGLWNKTRDLARGRPLIVGDTHEEMWALRDVSFEIRRGETVGIIGRNGAGKSTLLKVLSRITEPSAGRVTIKGRVASLLEVGTGFHPELTGRENIYLNGAILGMTRAEIKRKFDEIVTFAEVERFLDTPVKRYSSGMYVRLAFAVAAHLEPEILVVDEVLAVGDAAFQKKSLGKMGDVAREGRTVLFVSHNMVALRSLCPRAIWLHEGKMQDDGMAGDIVADYLGLQTAALHEQRWDDLATAPGNEMVRLHRVWIEPEDDRGVTDMPRETPLKIGVEYWQFDPAVRLHVNLRVYVEQQIIAFTTASSEDSGWQAMSLRTGRYRSICVIPAKFLNTGQHRIYLRFYKSDTKTIYTLEEALVFDVIETEPRQGTWFGRTSGAVRPRMAWSTEYLGQYDWNC
ncbi:MAG: ATP-binding cassette domain-containing protein [Candidatus Promineofilum sp.]|nr:ATP-binding cassette domain-containing protein [Promineifilum sp.]